MSATTEKTVKPSNVARQTATQETFFRKADEQPAFFGGTQEPGFFSDKGSSFFPPVQPKLSVSSPDDPYEKEADAVAEKIMRMPEPVAVPKERKEEEKLARKEDDQEIVSLREAPAITPLRRKTMAASSPAVQRSVLEPADDYCTSVGTGQDALVQTKTLAAGHMIQRSGRDPPASSPASFEAGLSASKGSGSALPGTTRAFMEQRFGTDFSGVRIHTGTQAQEMNRAINAQAFAHGNDIYFNSGRYAPDTTEGKHLLAHELTHTVQQGASTQQISPARAIYRRLDNGPPGKNAGNLPTKEAAAVAEEKKQKAINAGLKQAGALPASPQENKFTARATPKGRTATRPVRRQAAPRRAQRKAKNPVRAGPQRKANNRQPGKKKNTTQKDKTGAGNTGEAKIGAPSPAGKAINAAELGKGGLAPIRSPYEHSQKVVDAIRIKANTARESFVISVSEQSTRIQQQLDSSLETLHRTGLRQKQQLQQLFTKACTDMSAVIGSSSAQVSAHGTTQAGRLSETHTSLSENVNTIFDSGHQQIDNLATGYADRSLHTADQAVSQIEGNVQSNIDQTYQIRDQKNNVHAAEPEVAEAMREAGNTVASDTTTKVSDGLTDAVTSITNSGPEAAGQFLQQGSAAADQLAQGKTGVDSQVNDIFGNAITGIGQMAQQAVTSIQQQETPIISGLSSFEQQITTQLDTQIAAKTADMHRAGTHIMTAFRKQSAQSLAAGDNYLTQISNQVSGVRISEKEVNTVQNYAVQDIARSYESLHSSLHTGATGITGEISRKTGQIITGIQSIANPVAAQLNGSVAQGTAAIRNSAATHVSQLTEGANSAVTGGTTVVSQVTAGLTEQVTAVDSGFGEALTGYSTMLQEQISQGNTHAGEPVGTLPSRIDSAQSRAAERAQRSWLENQLADAWESLSDPGFWAGLVVGLVLAVIFIAIIAGTALTGGALLAVLVVGFAAIGAIAGAVGSMVGQATGHSFTRGWDWGRVNWGEVGKAALMGAAAGAAIAVVAFVAVESFGIAATGLGMVAVMSVASGVVGIISNVINGQPWDKGLLFNMALGGLLTWLGGKVMGGGARPPVEAPPVEPPVEAPPVQPAPVEPVPVEPTPVEPVPVEPVPVEPAPVEPAPVEPAPVEPAPVEPVPVEPTPVEPTPPEPAPVEPTPEEPPSRPLSGRRPPRPERPVVDGDGNLTEYGRWYYERPGEYRAGTRQGVWDQAKAASPDGVVKDPVSGNEVTPDSWRMEERPNHEFSTRQRDAANRGLGREEFMDDYNDPQHYRVREPRATTEFSGPRPARPEQPVLDAEGSLTEYGRWYYERPSGFRTGVRDTVYNNEAASSIDGIVRDPLTGEPIARTDPWEMGHRPGYEFWKHRLSAARRGIGRDQFIDEHNDPTHYRPETPESNHSHRGEAPDNVYHGP